MNDLFAAGIRLNRAGKPSEAIVPLEKAASDFPNAAFLLWYLGAIYLHELKQPTRALPLFRKASELNPKSEKASLGVFHSLWDLGRHEDALEEIKRFQVLTDWSCKDYLEIMDEIKEKWLNEKPAEQKLRKTQKPKSPRAKKP